MSSPLPFQAESSIRLRIEETIDVKVVQSEAFEQEIGRCFNDRRKI